jgi:transketolase
VLYGADEAFSVGGSKVLRCTENDDVTLVGAGVTLHEALRAADLLSEHGVHARVIDCYSIKPIDSDRLMVAAAATNGHMVVAEDHHPEGGLGSAVKDSLLDGTPRNVRIVHLAVRGLPGSGTGAQLLGWAGIDAEHIAVAARQLLSSD